MLFNLIKNNYRVLSIILLAIYFICEIISGASNFGGGAASVFSTLFELLIDLVILGIFIFAFVTNNDSLYRLLVVILTISFGYQALRGFQDYLTYCAWGGAVDVMCGIFGFALYILIAFIFVYAVARVAIPGFLFLPNTMRLLALVIIPLSILVGILFMIFAGTYGFGFGSFFSYIGTYFAFIPLMVISYLNYYDSNTYSEE